MQPRRVLLGLGLCAIGLLAYPGAAAQALDYASNFRATLTGSERQDWRVVGDTGAPCAPVGSGTQTLTVRAARPVVVSFHQELRGPASFFVSRVPVTATVNRIDNTVLNPPRDPGDTCSAAGTPRDCGTHGVRGVAITGSARGTRGRLEVGGVYDDINDYRNCFAPESRPGVLDFDDATARWPRFGSFFRPGRHRLTATRRLPPRTIRDTDYGDVEQTSTITWTLTLDLSHRRSGRCRGVRFKTCE